MNLKEEIGKKIRFFRESKHLTREMICSDESDITVRQLARIESGESLPTLTKLTFLSQKLNVGINSLIDENYIELPAEYMTIKKKIIKQTLYKDTTRFDIINSLFDKVYDDYYDLLSEDEQVTIDVLRATKDIVIFDNIQFEAGILKEYFDQTLLKSELTEIDFLVIHIFFLYVIDKDIIIENKFKVNKVINKLINNSRLSNDINSYLAVFVQIPALHILYKLKDYTLYRILLDTAQIIMEENQEFQKKPVILMLEAKYILSHEKNIVKAKEFYIRAAQTALFIGDELLNNKILEEMEKDLEG